MLIHRGDGLQEWAVLRLLMLLLLAILPYLVREVTLQTFCRPKRAIVLLSCVEMDLTSLLCNYIVEKSFGIYDGVYDIRCVRKES